MLCHGLTDLEDGEVWQVVGDATNTLVTDEKVVLARAYRKFGQLSQLASNLHHCRLVDLAVPYVDSL